jgi:GMP synthase-like glutamine amidotransferase
MLIGILETGRVNETLIPRYGEYAPMFEAWLRRADPGFAYRAYATLDGEIPASPAECDAWLVTGSKHGVYDDLPWIDPLKAFLRASRAAGQPIIGVCFGHQILAEALGGQAMKSAKGWGAGAHEYDVVRRPAWMAGAPDSFAIHAMHQDQVTAIPEDATPRTPRFWPPARSANSPCWLMATRMRRMRSRSSRIPNSTWTTPARWWNCDPAWRSRRTAAPRRWKASAALSISRKWRAGAWIICATPPRGAELRDTRAR